MLELLIYISYGIALFVWIILSFLLVRHIQALTEIRGIIKITMVLYFAVCLGLIVVSFYFLTGLSFGSVPVVEPVVF